MSYLSLSGNDFNNSEIPKSISLLNNLKYLDLNSTNLSGPIPFQLGKFLHLQYLDLSWNNLKPVRNLEWLFHLVSIEHLGKKLAFSPFKKIIQHFALFPKLIREMPLF